MAPKKRTKSANVTATIYEGQFCVEFSCVEVDACRFTLCHVMPPDGSEPCIYSEHSMCTSPLSRLTALELIHRQLTKELKQLKEDAE